MADLSRLVVGPHKPSSDFNRLDFYDFSITRFDDFLLRDVIEAEEIRLDRWTVVFRPLSEESDGVDAGKAGGFSGMQPGEDNAQVRGTRMDSTLRRSARITGDTAVSAAMRKTGYRSSKKTLQLT